MGNAVLDTATGVGYVKRWGETDFAPVGPDEVQVALNPGAHPDTPGAPRYHYTVVGGNFVLLSPADQATADAAIEAAKNAMLEGAQSIARVFQNVADLPLPPPIARVLVAVVNGPGGLPGLAMSTNDRWILFAAGGSVGP